MKKRAKRLAALLLTGIILFVSGCGSEPESTGGANAEGESSANKEKTIVTWYNVDAEPTKLLEAFNSTHDDIEVVYELRLIV